MLHCNVFAMVNLVISTPLMHRYLIDNGSYYTSPVHKIPQKGLQVVKSDELGARSAMKGPEQPIEL